MIQCLVVTGDLMLQSQISQVARSQGIACQTAGNVERLVTLAADPDVRLLIVDLESVSAESLAEAAVQLQSLPQAPLCLAVGPHVHKRLLEGGKQAGWHVLTRGQLHSQLGQILSSLQTA